ncbi:MAG: hypothetical protein ACXWW0_02705, partial [Bacteroidia bacterium]
MRENSIAVGDKVYRYVNDIRFEGTVISIYNKDSQLPTLKAIKGSGRAVLIEVDNRNVLKL